MQVTTAAGTGGKAWPYAALYAPDRTDYPANVLRGREGKVVAVWRIGTCTTGWNSDEPRTPWTNWTQMKLTFRRRRFAHFHDRHAWGGHMERRLVRACGAA